MQVYLLIQYDKADVSVTPRRVVMLPDKHDCRNTPHNEIVLRRLTDLKIDNSSCRPYFVNLGKRLNNILSHLPMCTDEMAIIHMMEKVYKGLPENEIKPPCIKLSYGAKVNTYKGEHYNQVKVKFICAHPSKVEVKEEYIIYDSIAFIGSVGGTLGLCIGFSFYTLTEALIDWLEIGIGQIRQRRNQRQLQIDIRETSMVTAQIGKSDCGLNSYMTKEWISSIFQEEFNKANEVLTKNLDDELTKIKKLIQNEN